MKKYLSSRSCRSSQRGYALPPLLIFMAICTAILVGWVNLSISTTRTVNSNKLRVSGYSRVEGALNTALSWVRANSAQILPLFASSTFCGTFDLSSSSSYSTNDPATNTFAVPTQLKLKGTTDSAMLLHCDTDCSGLGSANFPTVGAFDAVSQFNALNVGANIVKVTLVDAIPNDANAWNANCAASGSGDATDFIPIFRIDAMTGNDSGSRVFGYVTGSLTYSQAVGFYGEDYVNIEKPCFSDHFTGSSPDHNTNSHNAKCAVGTKGDVTFANNPKSRVYGTVVTTNGTVDLSRVCTSNPPGNSCDGAGSCIGTSCFLPDPYAGLCPNAPNPAGGPYTNNPFTTICSTNQGAICSGTGLGNAGAGTLSTPGCYNQMDTGNNGTLTLTSANSDPSYYFQLFNPNHGTLSIAPNPATGVITVHIKQFLATETTGCQVQLNGNTSLNVKNNKTPSQLRMVYWGICDVKFSGNSNESLVFYAPRANVIISGNSDFYGACFGKSLYFKDFGGSVVYDESMGTGTLSEITFKMRNVEETYR